MMGTAWTVLLVPSLRQCGGDHRLMKNAWGPEEDVNHRQEDGGQAQRTNVAGGMSGSPVYIDGN